MNDVKRLECKIKMIQLKKRAGKIILIMAMVMLILVVTLCSLILNNQSAQTEKLDMLIEIANAEEDAEPELEYVYNLSDSERDLVERVVAAEARGESFKGQMAVAQVIRDRCLERGQSPAEVCSAPNQFAAPYMGEISSTTEAAVGFVFEGGHNVLTYPVTHFYAHELIDAPDWAKEDEFVAEIGAHKFYR